MEKMVFSIHDTKAGHFTPPFMAHNYADAERSIIASTQQPGSMLGQFPHDFDLYFLGTFNDQSGKYSLEDAPKHHISVTSLLPKT